MTWSEIRRQTTSPFCLHYEALRVKNVNVKNITNLLHRLTYHVGLLRNTRENGEIFILPVADVNQ